ncbi:MAG: M28 family peptidase [Bacteroidota bacterium]
MKRLASFAVAMIIPALFLASCQMRKSAPTELKPALESITSQRLLEHIKTLSSDEFEGRAPGTKGEDLTVQYVTEQFQKLGLKPGNPDGSYIQKVPLVGFTGKPTASFTAGAEKISPKNLEEILVVSRRFVPEVKVNRSGIVFVGYGVVAPEYGWDDYKDVDVKGKTILMLVNDPAVPDPRDPSKLDSTMFKGRAMTYYGRWTYKFEIASEKGAAAAIIIHETGPAGYPFEVVSGSWGRENFDIKNADNNMSRVAVESWITTDVAKRLLSACGKNFDDLKKAAIRKDFLPVALNATADFHVKNTLREVESRNVIAKLEGSDPKLKNDYIVYTAHWDHLGMDRSLKGDKIFNGALDNASGTAGLIEVARALTTLQTAPRRSFLFIAVTGEEKGLLGAKYYATHPLYPLERTLADINIDGINQWGRTKDIIAVGFGNTTLDDALTEAAGTQNRTVGPDAEPEKGFYYRSDHFEFAKQGVPALYVDPGIEYLNKPQDYGKKKREEYADHDYHNVSDEIKPDWDLSGGVEDLQLLLQVGYHVAREDAFPVWKPGTEFKAKRESMLQSFGK